MILLKFIECQYQSQSLVSGVDTGRRICSLGLHGGTPFIGQCNVCIERNNNNPVLKQAVSFSKSFVNWANNRFLQTPSENLIIREKICRDCEQWSEESFNKTGRCKICKCSTWAKLRMASERCPIGKWEAATASHELRVQDNLTSEQDKTLTPKTT